MLNLDSFWDTLLKLWVSSGTHLFGDGKLVAEERWSLSKASLPHELGVCGTLDHSTTCSRHGGGYIGIAVW